MSETLLINKLNEADMGNLLASVGNNEVKANLLRLMKPDTFYGPKDLSTLFISSQGENPGWRLKGGTLYPYCWQTFERIGLVARGLVDPVKGVMGYGITEYGFNLGIPLAGLLLDFSKRHEQVSLYKLFGNTASKATATEVEGVTGTVDFKPRSPLMRYKIMWELVTSHLPIRTADLVERLGTESKHTATHLTALAEGGYIVYASSPSYKPWIAYRVNTDAPEEPPMRTTTPTTLINTTHRIIQEDSTRWWDIDDLVNKLVGVRGVEDNRSFRGHVYVSVNELVKRGYVLHRQFSREQHSEINLTPEQRTLLLELVETLDSLQNLEPNTLERGRKLANTLNERETAALMLRAKSDSPNSARIPHETTTADILGVISSNPGLHSGDIREILNKQRSRKVTLKFVLAFLSELEESGQIKSAGEKIGRTWHTNI